MRGGVMGHTFLRNFFWAMALLFYVPANCLGETRLMEYRYWNGTGGRNHYELELLELALEKTASSYPPYSISENNDDLASSRARREVEKGRIINVYTAPIILNQEINKNQLISINIPILKGMLGYRRIIIREEDEQKFTAIRSEQELKTLRVGQGRDWQDNVIYQANAFNLIDNGEFEQLAPMLSQYRFDYIPLGIAEVEDFYAAVDGPDNNMIIDPSLLIYYPLPVFFYVSGRYPEHARRLEEGLAIATADGSLDALFQQRFATFIDQLDSKNFRVFVLKNPYVPKKLGLEQPRLVRKPAAASQAHQ